MRNNPAKSSIWILPLFLLIGFCLFLGVFLWIELITRLNNHLIGITVAMVTPVIVFIVGLWLILRLVEWSVHKIDNPPKKKKRKRS
jgi:uncharacterized protein HemY